MTHLGFLCIFSTFVFYANCQSTSCQQQQPAVSACECSKLDECLKNQRAETEKFESECKQSCAVQLGQNSAAISDCLTAYETEKLDRKLSMEKCMNDIAGRQCSGNDSEVKTFVFNTTLIAQTTTAGQPAAASQNSAFIKNNQQLNSYKKCFKTCMKRSKSLSQASSTGKPTKMPNCYVQSGCQMENDPTKKSLRKLAKSNCAMQMKMDKISMKQKLADCLQAALNKYKCRSNDGRPSLCQTSA